jgi:hypothetical protein
VCVCVCVCVQGGCDDVEVLSGVVTVCKCALTLESLNFTSELAETLQIIHGMTSRDNHVTHTFESPPVM